MNNEHLKIPLMGIWYAIALHLLWAFLLVWNESATNATALAALSRLFPAVTGLVIVLFVVSLLAICGLFYRGNGPWGILLLVPQQLALGVSAAGAIRAMWLGQFADGVERSHVFLIADQCPAVLAFSVHSATILFLAVRKWK